MRINEYNNLDEFIYEYDSDRDVCNGKFIGIEFLYNGIYYRMCREPLWGCEEIILSDGRKGRYDVMVLHCTTVGYPKSDEEELIGWYADIYDVLDNCMIQGRPFREVIMADETEILSKD